jgi:hypothetical protein
MPKAKATTPSEADAERSAMLSTMAGYATKWKTEGTGEWNAAFRRLQTEAHTCATLMGQRSAARAAEEAEAAAEAKKKKD